MEALDLGFVLLFGALLGSLLGGGLVVAYSVFLVCVKSVKELSEFLLSQKAETNIENVKE